FLPEKDYLPSWYDDRITGRFSPSERAAAIKTKLHANTPTIVHMDVLGRIMLEIRDNGPDELLASQFTIDIQSNHLETINSKGRVVARSDFDMIGTRIHHASMDSAE